MAISPRSDLGDDVSFNPTCGPQGGERSRLFGASPPPFHSSPLPLPHLATAADAPPFVHHLVTATPRLSSAPAIHGIHSSRDVAAPDRSFFFLLFFTPSPYHQVPT
ncbi:hypothetical protein Salat_1741500 [Sesamum alatum]|uniref:Uncharacterized protein n=1 Tax=Sesamum alatum TaxID=300844 RepID=A0AAE1Y8G0_9LAMI|nr:hypothetical protein Salat_1741500 [Sesamum alatum]